jgi:uncharacterized protein with HEPN domain
MRNILVHDYDGVNIGTVADELPRNCGNVWNSDSSNSEGQIYECKKME